MKKIFILFILLFSYTQSFAQFLDNNVRYTSRSYDNDMSFVECYAFYKEGTPNIIIKISYAGDFFDDEPVMMIKLSDDEVLRLSGRALLTTSFIDDGDDSGYKSVAIFPITDEIVEKLKNGISKIRLYTIPSIQEGTFNKDKVGKKLYRLFQKRQKEETEF